MCAHNACNIGISTMQAQVSYTCVLITCPLYGACPSIINDGRYMQTYHIVGHAGRQRKMMHDSVLRLTTT